MSDFRIQFVEGTIASATATLDVNSPTFAAVDDFSKSFMVPALNYNGACVGQTSGTLVNTMANKMGLAKLIDADTVRFDDLDSANARNDLCGAFLVEYIGATGGVNEVIVRAVQDISGSAGTFDGPAISGIANLSDVVPFVFGGATVNGNGTNARMASVEVVNNGTDNVVRVTKLNTTDTMNLRVYVVEFVGSGWTVQKVNHTFSASSTNEDDTISSVNVANSWVVSTFQSSSGTNAQNLFYVWLENSTTLRHFVKTNKATLKTISYVITNPQLAVTVYGNDPDGTSDLTATGTSPETQNLTVSAVPDLSAALVTAHMGSDLADQTATSGILWLLNFTSTTNVQMRRSSSSGGTEYKIQVVDFSGVIGAEITSVDPIIDGETFTIRGHFGSSPTVTLNGVTQTVSASDATSITCTGVLSTLKYGRQYDLVVTAGSATVQTIATILPPPNKDYVDLAPPLAPNQNRIATTADLDGSEQVEWSLVSGISLVGVSDVIVYQDAAFSVSQDVRSFSVRVNDGTGWGNVISQIILVPTPQKTKALTCPTASET